MNKTANIYENTAAGLGLGAAGYGLIRLLNETFKDNADDTEPMQVYALPDVEKRNLKKQKKKQIEDQKKQLEDSKEEEALKEFEKMNEELSEKYASENPLVRPSAISADYVLPLLALPTGFLGAQLVEKLLREKAIRDRKKQISETYAAELEKLSSAEEYPLINNLCLGIANSMKKDISLTKHASTLCEALVKSVKVKLAEVTAYDSRNPLEVLSNAVTDNDVARAVIPETKSQIIDPALAVMLGLGSLSFAGTYGLAKYLSMQDAHKRKREKLQTAVQLANEKDVEEDAEVVQ